jgi:hypothetical protein
MFPGFVEFAGPERVKERLQEAERVRLISAARLQRTNRQRGIRKVANWIRVQVVRWGSKLPDDGTASTPQEVTLTVTTGGYSQN